MTLYADPASVLLLLRAGSGTPWQRVLYNGLHSFDFAPLLARPLLRVSLLVGLCVLGLALCVTACVLAWRGGCWCRPGAPEAGKAFGQAALPRR